MAHFQILSQQALTDIGYVRGTVLGLACEGRRKEGPTVAIETDKL